jgi:predicted Co/Zn/Cd cation transporter (cation efflux family)
MKPLSPSRTFVDPGNVRDLPGVTRRTPIQRRESPLPGTKTLLCPKDEHLREMVTGRAIEVVRPSRTADILGYLAMAGALVQIALFWILPILQQTNPTRHGGVWVVIIGLAIVHVLAIFSQVLSGGRNIPGGLAILVLYVGFLVSVVVAHFVA